MVSIIIPTYNCEAYVDECVRSILNQEVTSIEVIVVDDGSNDRTPNILDCLSEGDCRVKVFHVENGGPSRARNIGLDHATGEWILFVDADDWVDRNILAKLNLDSDTAPDITFFGFKRCFDDGGIETCIPSATKMIDNADEISHHLKTLLTSKEEFFGYSCNKIYKSSIIQKNKIRFQEGLQVREDELFALNYCQHIHSIQILGFAPYNYRILSNSLSHGTEIKYRNYFRLAQVEQRLLKAYPQSMFRDAFMNKVFHFYVSAIIESIRFSKSEKQCAIEESIHLYDASASQIVAPTWVKCLYDLPVKALRKHIVNAVFYVRNQLKKV